MRKCALRTLPTLQGQSQTRPPRTADLHDEDAPGDPEELWLCSPAPQGDGSAPDPAPRQCRTFHGQQTLAEGLGFRPVCGQELGVSRTSSLSGACPGRAGSPPDQGSHEPGQKEWTLGAGNLESTQRLPPSPGFVLTGAIILLLLSFEPQFPHL